MRALKTDPELEILCAARSTVYRSLPNALVRTRANSAWLTTGTCRVIAHPPCRFWCRARALAADKPSTIIQELMLGLWCAFQVKIRGGVLEQPAHSRLWDAANLPRPHVYGQQHAYSIAVDQAAWGHHGPKPTWLFFCGIPKHTIPPIPLSFVPTRRRTLMVCTNGQRSATPPAFMDWLCQCLQVKTPIGTAPSSQRAIPVG